MAKPRRRKNQSTSHGSGSGSTNGSGKGSTNGSTSQPSVNEDIKQTSSTASFVGKKSIVMITCAVSAFLLYANAIWMCGFCYDDYAAIQTNPDVLHERVGGHFDMSPWRDVWRHDYWGTNVTHSGSHKSYRPLVIFSFRLDASLISRDPWAFHLVNALLYAVTCWMVVHFMLTNTAAAAAVGSAAGDSPRKLRKKHCTNKMQWEVLLLSGLWFASHPIHTEAVASLVGRAEILAALFCIVGARLHSGCKRDAGGRMRLLACAVCFFAACLCKEPAVVIPAVLAGVEIMEILLSQKTDSSNKAKSMGLAACLAALSVGYVLFRAWLFSGIPSGQTSRNLPVSVNFMQHLGPMDKLRTAIFVQTKYLQKLAWPGSLSHDYSLGVINPVHSWASPEMTLVAIMAIAIAVWAWYGLVRLRRLGDTTLLLALGWTVGPLVPASHVVDIGTVLAERLLFLPSIGAVMLLCFVGIRLAETVVGGWSVARVVLALCICLFAVQTMNRNADWASTDSLNAADLAKNPQSLKLLLHCASRQVPEEKAFQCAKDANDVLERHSTALVNGPYNEGLLWMADIKTRAATWPQGANLHEALLHANKAIAMGNRFGRNDWSFVHQRKGTALLDIGQSTGDQGKLKEAAAAFAVAIEHDDHGSGHLYCLLATSNAVLGNGKEAQVQFHKCFQLKRQIGQKSTSGSHFMDYLDHRNYAILMHTLSGVNQNDSVAAQKWGKEAIQAIETLMAWPNEAGDGTMVPESELKLWDQVKNSIRRLMKES